MPSSADLGPRLESYVTTLVKEGRYGSRSEVLREGVRLVEEREKRLTLLDAALARGIADADADRVTPAQDVRARLIAKYETPSGPDA
ncbi:type II toxin-antitoxin system ParD family antitoxin [Methylorubrum thiocyanatum]|jgi:antitoxin ParD1/3/4|uniref:type II toxin-antitoxin system ParD family antitoxin n=1 Tax=Methylorubrum TaxID=2282523 RepID=UPI0011543837|nr:type II toxin-antitoxin system ParD family antitoxin [Methylorubrum populi]QDI81751.1 type II toxin-antitoxin system ParD family antitoxin [Methylorubrum populi]